MTESGKTTLAKQLARIYRSQKLGVIVLDPMNDPEWDADYKSDNNEEFLSVVKNSESCHVFVDEAGDAIGRYDVVMQQLATKFRHFGHSCYFITQRGAQLSATIRAQCRHLFLFTSAADDCKTLAREYNQPELLTANNLPQGHYFHAARFAQLQRGQLW